MMQTTFTSDLLTDAAWVLTAAFTLSILYELFRATRRAGVSEHDSMRAFVVQLPQYVIAAGVIGVLFAGFGWSVWVGLALCAVVIVVSIGFYNPRIMSVRRPRFVDWFEDLMFTGLVFVAAAQLGYRALGA